MVLRQLITMKTHGKIPVIMEVESGGFRSMKTLVLSLCVAGSTLMAAGLQNKTQLRGDYIEARTADVFTGPCFANAEVDAVGNLAVFGWKVNAGTWEGVKLDGLSVVGVVKAQNTLGNIHSEAYPVK